MIDDKGKNVKTAGPSVPVEVLGLSGVPQAGDTLTVVENEARAREVADYRQEQINRKRTTAAPTTFEHMRSEEHTSELQSLMRISYAVFCLKKKKNRHQKKDKTISNNAKTEYEHISIITRIN